MIITPDQETFDEVLRENPYPPALVIPRKTPLQRWILGIILLTQKAHGLKGLKMPTIEITISGTKMTKKDVEQALPVGAKLVAFDEGSGNVYARLESDDPFNALVSVSAISVSESLMTKVKETFSKAELVAMLDAAGVERNDAGTLVSEHMSESELITLVAKSMGIEGLRGLVDEDVEENVGEDGQGDGGEAVAIVDGGDGAGDEEGQGDDQDGAASDAPEGESQPDAEKGDGDGEGSGDDAAAEPEAGEEPPVG